MRTKSRRTRGTFIVIDGIDGSGKTTQVRMLKAFLSRAVFTHDPGGAPASEAIRSILLGKNKLAPLSTFLLFLASRVELVAEVIAPALRQGKVVICDRFDSSTYAYQIHAGKYPELFPLMRHFNEVALEGARPDAYIILDSDPREAKKRLARKSDELNAYDRKPTSYHRRVREGFKKFKPRGSKILFVDADRTAAEVFQDVKALVERILT